MADRKLKDWITSYLQWTEDTEPARIFQKWTALSVIAGALRKKVCLSLGRLRVYPNMYIIFVAEPGRARKTQAIDFGVKLMSNLTELVTSADATSKEALLDDLEKSKADEVMPNGDSFAHCSLNIISREFESFLGQKKENTKMVVFLTDLFDAKELPFKYHTKHSGSNNIPSPYLNLLAATTPDSIASCLPSSAIGGGLTSRILFIWATQKYKKVSRPENNSKIIKLEEDLISDLFQISRIVGNYEFTKKSGELWDDWYNKYDEDNISRLCKDPSFNGWYSRKPMYILKVAQACAASKTNKLIMEFDYILEAISFIEEIEKDMTEVFRAVGKSTVTSEVDMLMQIIRQRRVIHEKALKDLVWRDMDAAKFENVITTAIGTGRFEKRFQGPKGEPGIWYYETSYYNQLVKEYEDKRLGTFKEPLALTPNKKE
jgi:hypothetical protein